MTVTFLYFKIGRLFHANSKSGDPYNISMKFNTTHSELGIYTFEFYVNMYCDNINCSYAQDYISLDIQQLNSKMRSQNIFKMNLKNISYENWMFTTNNYNSTGKFTVCIIKEVFI